MQGDTKRRMQYNIYVVTLITVLLATVFYSGLSQVNWLVVLFFTALQVFLQESMVSVNERSKISLGMTIVLPMIYLCGATPAVLIVAFKGLYDGLKSRKSWYRTLFNSSQFALSTLLASLSLEYLSVLFGGTGVGVVLAFSGATAVYIFCNIGLICHIASVWRGTSWWTEIKAMVGPGFYSHVSSGFIGILFTLFVMSYGFWGLIAFSALVINLSALLKAAAAVSTERSQREKLERQLVIDEMTGAYNFRYLNNWLSNPAKETIALIFMDIDNFAAFNNTYGHAHGDEVLRQLVGIINQSVRDDDRVIRYGGDEFVVLLKGMNAEGAKRVGKQIMDNLVLLRNPKWAEPITVSWGIAVMPQHTEDKRQLLLFADQAMYWAKESGKNTMQMWSPRGCELAVEGERTTDQL